MSAHSGDKRFPLFGKTCNTVSNIDQIGNFSRQDGQNWLCYKLDKG